MTDAESLEHEIHALSEWFRALLEADTAPRTDKAVFWHEVVHPQDGPLPQPVTRGSTFLEYYAGVQPVGEVPGQAGLAKERFPESRARQIVWSSSTTPTSLVRIAFHYERVGGEWTDTISTETHEERVRLAKDLAAFRTELAGRFAALWTEATVNMGIQFGIPASQPAPGPRWRLKHAREDGSIENGFQSLPRALAEAHEELLGLLVGHGRHHLLSYVFSTKLSTGEIDRTLILYY